MTLTGFVLALDAGDTKVNLKPLVADFGYSKPTAEDPAARLTIGDVALITVERNSNNEKQVMVRAMATDKATGMSPENASFVMQQLLHDFTGAELL